MHSPTHGNFGPVVPIGRCLAALAILLTAAAASVRAQRPGEAVTPRSPVSAEARAVLAAADSALERCGMAARERRGTEAAGEADRADGLYRSVESDPAAGADALTGRARILVQCRIPFANFMAQGSLVNQANEFLERALSLDSTHVGARFSLAVNHYAVPAFLGRTGDGIREFERLIAQLGDRTDVPVLATAHLYLGELYERAGRPDDALATWRRGADRFPDHAGLRRKLEPPDPTESAEGTDDPPYALRPIVVEAGSYAVEDPRSATALDRITVYTTPGGAADVLQVFQTMPGVTRATEGSDLYVRGGDPAEAPVYVDGARMFYAGKFETLNGGIFGVLDPAVLKRAYFSSGGFSARYGNALSGVLDVETEGLPAGLNWRAGANLASAGATGRVPIRPGLGGWGTFSVTDTRALLRLQGKHGEYPVAPRAAEGMAGIALEARPGLELRATALVESDDATRDVEAYGYAGPFRSRGTTRLGTLSLHALGWEGAAALRVSASASLRRTGFAFGVLDRERTDRGATLRVDGDFAPASGFRLSMGVEGATMRGEETGTVPLTDRLAPGSPAASLDPDRRGASHLGAYIENELRVTPRAAMILGVRADRLPGESGWSVDPRAAAAFLAGEWTLRVGGGIYRQGRWRVSYRIPDLGAPSGIPTRARHVSLGAQRQGVAPLRLEAYIKAYDGYVPFGEGPRIAAGRAAGLDALLRWPGSPRLNGWLSYAFLDAVVDLEDGRRVPSAADVTHTLTVVAKTSPIERWELGFTGRYGTGRPLTPILGPAEPGGPGAPPEPLYGPIHGGRLPDLIRLDARLTHLAPVRGGLLVLYVEALNLLDRANVLAYTYDESYRNRRPVESFFADRTLVLGVEAQF